MKRFTGWVRAHVDGRDLLCALGLASLGYGGEMLYAGAGFAAVGAVAVAIAVLVR